MGTDQSDRILQFASDVFGFRTLRPGQREAIQSVLERRDTLAVMPTGAGKSAIFALSGSLLNGTTIVISPLLALQRDQVAALGEGGMFDAVAINSASPARDRQQLLDAVSAPDTAGGPSRVIFLAPEQLSNSEVLQQLASLQPALVAVDEAHLVSQWGPDFRPDYLRIAGAVQALGRPVVLALTATAAPPVRDEIISRLGMRNPNVVVTGFARPNIDLSVHSYFTGEGHKLETLSTDVLVAARSQGHGIVYGATRKRVQTLAEQWVQAGLRAAGYHAGLSANKRLEIEGEFRDGNLDVVVATIAFGMGIDKPDVRWVYHAEVPGSIDEYYQEFGRAGRDGKPAEAAVYFRPEDLRLPKMYASRTGPSVASLKKLAEALKELFPSANLHDVASRADLSRKRASSAAMALADVGGLTVAADGIVTICGDIDEAMKHAAEAVAERRSIERSRIEAVEAYCEAVGCRWKFILEYFGEPTPDRCGHCDNDVRSHEDDDEEAAERPFVRGSRVRHVSFGEGEVVGYAGGRILLAFDHAGYKRLDITLVVEGGLLEALDQPERPAV